MKRNCVDSELKTKFPKILSERVKEILEKKGMSVYEYLQHCCLLLLKYDMHKYYCEQPGEECLYEIITQIMNYDNTTDVISGMRKSIREDLFSKEPKIHKVVIIMDGGFSSEYTIENGTWVQSLNTEETALNILTEGCSSVRKNIKRAMNVMGYKSFEMFVKRLVDDIEPDIATIIRNNNSGHLTTTYGIVPKKKLNNYAERSIIGSTKKRTINPAESGHFDCFETSIEQEVDTIFDDYSEYSDIEEQEDLY